MEAVPPVVVLELWFTHDLVDSGLEIGVIGHEVTVLEEDGKISHVGI
jgi:hypothetical protein